MLVEPWVPPVLVAPPELLTPASGLPLPPVPMTPPLPLVTPASWAVTRSPFPSHEHVTSRPEARMMRTLATRKVWMRSRMSFSSMLGFETCASRRRSPKRGCLVNNSNYDATLLQPLQACQVLMMSGPPRQSLAFSMNRVTATSQISEAMVEGEQAIDAIRLDWPVGLGMIIVNLPGYPKTLATAMAANSRAAAASEPFHGVGVRVA